MQINKCNCGGSSSLHSAPARGFKVSCNDCDVQTRIYNTPEEAIEAWHKVMNGNKLSADVRKVLEAVASFNNGTPCPCIDLGKIREIVPIAEKLLKEAE